MIPVVQCLFEGSSCLLFLPREHEVMPRHGIISKKGGKGNKSATPHGIKQSRHMRPSRMINQAASDGLVVPPPAP